MSKGNTSNNELGRKIGLWTLIAVGVGATVGSGIFSTISEVAGVSQSGLFLAVAFLIGALMQIPGSFCYAELSSAYPVDGGHYIYFREAGLKCSTFVIGWLTFFCLDAPGVAVMAIAISNYLTVFINCNPIFLRLIGAAIIAFFAYTHIRSVKFGGFIQAFITFLKLIPFLIIVGIGIFFINPDIFLSANDAMGNPVSAVEPNGLLALTGAIALSTYSFDGMFAGSYLSGEVKNPKKVLPLGLVLTSLVVLVLYVALSSTATGLIPIDQLASSKAPIADMVAVIPVIGPYASYLIAGMAIIVIIGTISSCMMYMPRFEYAMARDGIMFSVLAKVHKKFETPYVAIIVFAVYAMVLSVFFDIGDLLSSLTIIILLKNTITYFLVFVLRRKDNYAPTYRCPGNWIMPLIAVVTTAAILVFGIITASITNILINVAFLLAGVITYFIFTAVRKSKNSK